LPLGILLTIVILVTVAPVAHRASSKWTRHFTSCTQMAAMLFARSVIASADEENGLNGPEGQSMSAMGVFRRG